MRAAAVPRRAGRCAARLACTYCAKQQSKSPMDGRMGCRTGPGLCLVMLVNSASAPTCGEGTTLELAADACTANCPQQETASDRVYIAGVFDLRDDGDTERVYSEQLKHHFQLTMDLLNNHSDGMWDDVLSNTTIEHTTADAGCDASLGARAYWGVRDWGRPLHGVIGCRCSSASKAVQRIAQLESVPQISMASTSHELSRYPYFYRTVAPEGAGGGLGAVVSLFRAFGWTRIGMLYTETDWARDTAQAFAAIWDREHPAQDDRAAWTGAIAYSHPIALRVDRSLDTGSLREAFAKIPVGNIAVNSRIIMLICHAGEFLPFVGFVEFALMPISERGLSAEHAWPIFQYAAESGFQSDSVFVGPGSWPGNAVPLGALSAFNTSATPGFLGLQNFENAGSPVYQSYKQRFNQYEVGIVMHAKTLARLATAMHHTRVHFAEACTMYRFGVIVRWRRGGRYLRACRSTEERL